MRTYLCLPLLVACTSTPSTSEPTYDTVRDRLAAESTHLFIGAEPGVGSIDARRWTEDGWVDGVTPISITDGALVASLAAGKLAATQFELAIDPIDLPESVFGKPARLEDVQIALASMPHATDIAWTSDDDATANVMLDVTLAWTIEINGGNFQLGTQHLPAIPLDLTISGSGEQVDAMLDLHAAGQLWSWAGLLELTDLDLTLTAATVP